MSETVSPLIEFGRHLPDCAYIQSVPEPWRQEPCTCRGGPVGYGDHEIGCPRGMAFGKFMRAWSAPPCDCGFDAALAIEARQPAAQLRLRHFLWNNHGHDGLYGDDGEMQCGRCRGADYLRDPLPILIEKAYGAAAVRDARARVSAPRHDVEPDPSMTIADGLSRCVCGRTIAEVGTMRDRHWLHVTASRWG